MTDRWRIIVGDARDRLLDLPAGSVQTCITSPPYYGLRDYGVDGQIGLEVNVDDYVAALVDVARGVRRVLRDDGTLWLNLGDSYAGGGGGNYGAGKSTATHREHPSNLRNRPDWLEAARVKAKDLIGVPWLVAFALRADGWFLRSDVIWAKPNPMPESVTDRPTRSHEYLFLLSKSPRYYYAADAIAEDAVDHRAGPPVGRATYEAAVAGRAATGRKSPGGVPPDSRQRLTRDDHDRHPPRRNRRTVWTVATRPYAGAHFATFPPELIEPCVLAGSPRHACAECGAPYIPLVERVDQGYDGSVYGARAVDATGGAKTGGTARSTLGSSGGRLTGIRLTTGHAPTCDHDAPPAPATVLDPFNGAGTTGLVAVRHGRAYVGIELNPTYAELARDRIETDIRLGHRPPKRHDAPAQQTTLSFEEVQP